MENDNRLKLMSYWIFGTFIIVWASALIYVGSVVGTGTAIFGQLRFWIVIVISALFCVLSFYGYKKYIEKE